MRCCYFGVLNPAAGLGHGLHSDRGSGREAERLLPFEYRVLDAALLPPNGPETEGVVHRSVINGWTVLTFWDRSGDKRFRSNSAFVLQGEHDIEDGLIVARRAWPSVFARFGFPLTAAENG